MLPFGSVHLGYFWFKILPSSSTSTYCGSLISQLIESLNLLPGKGNYLHILGGNIGGNKQALPLLNIRYGWKHSRLNSHTYDFHGSEDMQVVSLTWEQVQ